MTMLFRIAFDIEARSLATQVSAGGGGLISGSASTELSYNAPASVYVAIFSREGLFKIFHSNQEAGIDHTVDCYGVASVDEEHINESETGLAPVLLGSGILGLSLSGNVSGLGYSSLTLEHFTGGENTASGNLLINNVRTAGNLHGSFQCRSEFREVRRPGRDIRPALTALLASPRSIRKLLRNR